MEDEKDLNPDIREIKYGKKVLKRLTLYPLSIGDQFKATNIITEIVQSLVEGRDSGNLSDFVFMTSVMKVLENNLGRILELVADIPEDEAKKIVSELTNSQLMEIVESVWSVDYEPALKKGRGLYERGKKVFNSERPLPSSSSSTPSTGLRMSSDGPTEPGD